MNDYYSESHKLRSALRSQELVAAGAALPSSSSTKHREEEAQLRALLAQLTSDTLATVHRHDSSVERQQALREALQQEEDASY